jgi:ribonuclease HI
MLARGARVVLTSPKGDKLRYMLQLHFACTNNIAEYEPLFNGLRIAKEMDIGHIYCYGDSDLVVQQVSGKWDAVDSNMAACRRAVDQLAGHFIGYELEHVDRRKNEEADELSRIGSRREQPPPGVFLDQLHNPTVKPPKEIELATPPSPD